MFIFGLKNPVVGWKICTETDIVFINTANLQEQRVDSNGYRNRNPFTFKAQQP